MCTEKLENKKELCLEEKVKIYNDFLENPSINDSTRISYLPVLTREEEVELAMKRNEGPDGEGIYRNSFFAGNLKLVRSWSKKYSAPTAEFHDLTHDDLMQEGSIGLLKAIENFDYEKGFKFSTYATFWIRQSISKAIMDKGDTIRLSTNQHEAVRTFKRSLEKIALELERMPTIKEIADILNIEQEEAASLIMSLGYKTASLDKQVENDGEDMDSLVDLIEDEQALNPEDEAIKTISVEEMRGIIDTVLSGKHSEVIKKRYGFEDGFPRTLESVGKEYGLTKEGIRQIESKALRKLKMHFITKNEQQELKNIILK